MKHIYPLTEPVNVVDNIKEMDDIKFAGGMKKLGTSSVRSEELKRFEKLSSVQRCAAFREQAYKIKQLQRKLRKCKRKQELLTVQTDYKKAKLMIKETPSELMDQGMLLSNLIDAINEEKLKLDSLQFDRICTIVNASLNTKPLAEFKETFENHTTKKEKIAYTSLINSPALFKVILGQNIETNEILDDYLKAQAEVLKKMTYEQFCATISKKIKFNGSWL